ncbi:IQ motif and SEC7 domain-containing protein 2-like [Poecilia formosa]|uniref:IQ motif and SEC7 domain-containing protein 2-like n=1 Tax=Poecilia formosa TaxID=48698 RepID=UPI0007B9D42F|nr:PREDICTED: IQ motif and SEC7 domain-containing protein 2-like [Poecilia formosa]
MNSSSYRPVAAKHELVTRVMLAAWLVECVRIAPCGQTGCVHLHVLTRHVLSVVSWAGKRGRRSSAGSLDSNLEGSIISSPHIRRRTPSGRDCASRHSGHSLPSSSSLLGSLFGTRRVKSPGPCPGPQSPHPTLVSHAPHPANLHHAARAESDSSVPVHPHPIPFCHVTQNPPPYHHHHHYHPPPHLQHAPHQCHVPPSHGQQPPYPPYPQHSHGSHSAHGGHLHGPPPTPTPTSQVPSSSTKPKHSGISTVV